MIESQSDFLPFFFQEPLYLVDEGQKDTAYQPLGDNRCQILVLVEEPDVVHLSEEGKSLLEKVLQAVQLSFEDVCLVNVNQAKTPTQLEKEVDFKTCLSFGMPPEEWQFSNFSKKYTVDRDETGRVFLWADTLAEIAQDVDKKKSLWLSLKTLFLTG